MDRFQQLSRTVHALSPVPEDELRAFFALGRPLDLAAPESLSRLRKRRAR